MKGHAEIGGAGNRNATLISLADASADLGVFDFVEREVSSSNALAGKSGSPPFGGRVA
jgi:hypothetical protein